MPYECAFQNHLAVCPARLNLQAPHSPKHPRQLSTIQPHSGRIQTPIERTAQLSSHRLAAQQFKLPCTRLQSRI